MKTTEQVEQVKTTKSEGIKLPEVHFIKKETGLQIRPMILTNKKNINKNNECKVYIEIVVIYPDRKQTRRIPTTIFVSPKNWKNQKVTKSDPEYIDKNILIDNELIKYKNLLYQREIGTWNEIEKDEIPSQVVDLFPKKTKTLIDFIDDYIQYRKDKKTPYGTLKEFTSLKNRLQGYEEHIGYKLTFENMNMSFSHSLNSYMINKGYNTGTIEKTYTILRTVLNHFYELKDEMNIQLTDKFRSKNWKQGEKSVNDPHPISHDEFDILLKHEFENQTYQKTKDRFILQCTTGMRYSDLFRITKDNIKDGTLQYYPVKTVHKKDNLVICPLNDISKGILKKYDYNTKVLYITNQKYNESLRLMFKLLNEKYEGKKFDTYSSHDGRDTFITYSLENGIQVPYLLRMVGQSSYDIMKRYFKEDINILIHCCPVKMKS